jgi:hypothetical protein
VGLLIFFSIMGRNCLCSNQKLNLQTNIFRNMKLSNSNASNGINQDRQHKMKRLDLVILVKYAQGLSNFHSYLSYIKFLKPEQRKNYLSEIAFLIMKLDPNGLNRQGNISLNVNGTFNFKK